MGRGVKGAAGAFRAGGKVNKKWAATVLLVAAHFSMIRGTIYAKAISTPSGYRATQLANPNLKWEAATQYNVGLDYTLFGNTLYGTCLLYTSRCV